MILWSLFRRTLLQMTVGGTHINWITLRWRSGINFLTHELYRDAWTSFLGISLGSKIYLKVSRTDLSVARYVSHNLILPWQEHFLMKLDLIFRPHLHMRSLNTSNYKVIQLVWHKQLSCSGTIESCKHSLFHHYAPSMDDPIARE